MFGPVLAQGVTLGDLVSIDLIATVQQQGKRRVPVIFCQACPHRIALGPFALQIADLLAVAGHIGDPYIASKITCQGVTLAVPGITGRAVCGQVEACSPNGHMIVFREDFRCMYAVDRFDWLRALAIVRNEKDREP